MVHRARQLFPRLSGRLVKAATCMYASAPDDAFVLGPLGGASQVVLACGFSGHGFKFVPVVGRSSPILSRPGRLRTTSRSSTSLGPPLQALVRTDRGPARAAAPSRSGVAL